VDGGASLVLRWGQVEPEERRDAAGVYHASTHTNGNANGNGKVRQARGSRQAFALPSVGKVA
jgi:hypothetical protein